MKSKGFVIIIAAIALFFIYNAVYTVSETEQAVITQFGKIIGEIKFKIGSVE